MADLPETRAERLMRKEDGPNFDNRGRPDGRPDRAVSSSDMVAVDAPRLEIVLTSDIDDVVERLRAAIPRYEKCRDDRPLVYTLHHDDPLTVGDIREAAAMLQAQAEKLDDLEAKDAANRLMFEQFKHRNNELRDAVAALKAERDAAWQQHEAIALQCEAARAKLERAMEGLEHIADFGGHDDARFARFILYENDRD